MKKLLSLLLALMMVLSLTACSDDGLTEAVLDLAVDMLLETEEAPTTDTLDEIPADDPAIGSVDYTDNTVEPQPSQSTEESPSTTNSAEEELIDADGFYYSKEDVSLYLVTYGELPDNYITKSEARDLGWEGGSVEDYAPGCAIGGDVFGNYEGLLPKAKGRVYYECDIDTNGYHSRGSRRIVFSNDGLIYYTPDHYKSFELLYGEE